MAKEECGSSVTVSPRRSARIRRKPERFVNNGADISSDSDLESVGGEGRRGGREPVARNQGRGRG